MKACENKWALGKGIDVSPANLTELENKISLCEAMFVNVDICRNLECQHVELTWHSTV
jgi:hypothetical protein